jgi:hypothetical protein
MPVDRIGKALSAMLPAGGADGAKRASEAPRAFEGARVEAPTSAEGVAPTSPLERLEAGGLDLPGYLDARVNDATSHLEGLGTERIGAIRAHLRSATASDPALVHLVQQATGQTPEET